MYIRSVSTKSTKAPRAGHAKDLVCATWHRQGALLHQSPGHFLLAHTKAHTSPSWLNRRLVCVNSEVCFLDLKVRSPYIMPVPVMRTCLPYENLYVARVYSHS